MVRLQWETLFVWWKKHRAGKLQYSGWLTRFFILYPILFIELITYLNGAKKVFLGDYDSNTCRNIIRQLLVVITVHMVNLDCLLLSGRK